jgi:molybdate transport system substrate-binding protein
MIGKLDALEVRDTFGDAVMKRIPIILLLQSVLLGIASADLSVFAASSTTEAMKEIATAFKQSGGETLHFNFSGSGTLARQIDAGAPADVFISANSKWMDWLEKQSAIQKDTRFNLIANSLVLIASNRHEESRTGNKEPRNGEGTEPLRQSKFLDRNSAVPSGRVAVGNFKSVPAGMYAEEALAHMGWLDALRPNLVMGSNVRTVLMYVERGEVAAGIVYSSDARASGKVTILGTFPADSHSPILYPAAACSDKDEVFQFLEFLKTDEVKAILQKHGFAEPMVTLKHKATVLNSSDV